MILTIIGLSLLTSHNTSTFDLTVLGKLGYSHIDYLPKILLVTTYVNILTPKDTHSD